MSSFLYLKGSCPVCGGERKDCRQNSDIIHCRTESPSSAYHFIKADANGFGMYVDNALWDEQRQAYSDERKREYIAAKVAERKELQKLAETDRAARYRAGLSEAHRDHFFRKIYDFHRRIHGKVLREENHLKDLHRRGLSDIEIEAAGFISMARGLTKYPDMHSKTPGFNSWGQFANSSGLLCPIKNADGLIVGFQNKVNSPEDGGKYRWIGGQRNNPSHLQNGELPLNVARPLQPPKTDYIGICEGILKSWIAAFRHNRIFVGAAGGNFASSPQYLKANLDKVSVELGTRRIVLFPDGGARHNPTVMAAYLKSVEILTEWGFEVLVAWWGQEKKEDGDVDEIAADKQWELISWNEFLPNGKMPQFNPLEKQAEIATQQRLERYHQEWKKSRKFTPDEVIDERFFPADLINWGKNLAIKSGLGTGKTEALARAMPRLKGGVICVGSRNSLLLQLCERLNLYHIREHLESYLQNDPNLRLALCADSLIHFADNPDFFKDKTLIIDEAESVVKHFLIGGTCKKNRSKIESTFELAAKLAKSVILLDGNLPDWVVQYIADLRGVDVGDFRKIQNNFKVAKPRVEFLLGTIKKGKLQPTNNKILHSVIAKSPRPIILTDSQIEAESLDDFLGNKGLRVDSKTIADPLLGVVVKEFLKNPDKWIRDNKPPYVILSPTAESGIDISIKDYFTDAYLISYGVLGVNSLLQMLGRCRHPNQIHVFVREYSRNEGTRTYTLPETKQILIDRQLGDFAAAIKENVEIYDKLCNLAIENTKTLHFDAKCIIKTQENYESIHLRDCLKEALIESGHELRLVAYDADGTGDDIELPPDTIIMSGNEDEIFPKIKAEIKKQNCEDILAAKELTKEEVSRIESNFVQTWEQQCQLIKYSLLDRLPGVILSTDLIYELRYTDRNLINKLNLRWQVLNLEDSKIIASAAYTRLSQRDAIPLGDIPARQLTAARLASLGVATLVAAKSEGKMLTASNPEIKKIFDGAKTKGIKTAIGFAPGKMAPMQFVGKVARLLGLELSDGPRLGSDGGRQSTHYIGEKSKFFKQIWQPICEKNRLRLEEAQNLIQQSFEARQATPQKDIYSLEMEGDVRVNSLVAISSSEEGQSGGGEVAQLPPVLQAAPPQPIPLYPRPDGIDLYNLEHLFLNLWDETYTQFQKSFFLWNQGTVYVAEERGDEVWIGSTKIPHYEMDVGGWILIKDERLIDGCKVFTNFERAAVG